MKKNVLFFVLLILLPLTGYSKSRYALDADYHIVKEAQKIMRQQVGTFERSNRNDGEVVRYLEPFGLPVGSPYCAAGIYWAYLAASVLMDLDNSLIPIPKTAIANAIFNYAKTRGKLINYSSKIYDLVIWNKAKTPFGHIEVIDSVGRGGNVITIGFNTSKVINNKRYEGVFFQKRNIHHPLGRMKIRGIVSFNLINSNY